MAELADISMKENPSVIQLAEMDALKALKCEFESHQRDHPFYKHPQWKIYGPYQRELPHRERYRRLHR